jgi:AcrR family transcriptional regulator
MKQGKTSPADQLMDAALELALSHRWRDLSMREIADQAGVSLADAYAAFDSKAHLLLGILSRIDRDVLKGGVSDATDPPRDRLFDVLMRRFDALTPHKAAFAAIARDLPADPLALLVTLPHFAQSMAWMLDTAGVMLRGPLFYLQLKALSLIYLNTFRVWLGDERPDLGRTMAALDKGLRQAESILRWLPGRAAAQLAAEPAADGEIHHRPAQPENG